MDLWNTIAALLGLTAGFAYLNHRWIRLPPSVGVMSVALSFSLGLLALQSMGIEVAEPIQSLVRQAHFDTTLLHGFLGFLLFAGALSVDLTELRRNGWVVGILATFGVVVSTLVVGFGTYWVMRWLEQPLPWQYCLLFGALISPTDPIAVLALLKRLGAPKGLEIKIAGESLFNDGVGVTLFLLMLTLVGNGPTPSFTEGLALLLKETLGGIAFGGFVGWLALRLLRGVDQYTVEILLTLASVSGGFALADIIGVSGPLAIVVAGLIIGQHGRVAMSTITRHHLDLFWHLLDEILNAILFVLIGLEVLVMHFHERYLGIVLALLPVVLVARLVSVGLPYGLLRRRWAFESDALGVMVWGGLRGGLSVAMALSLPAGGERDLLVAATYGIVVFGLLVQGSSLGWIVRAHLRPRT
ncbi:MAG: sodium:proton antiporter [Chromatiaceae bacterium]|nr:sodium:proton antiporter [Chromatiaceae bacterium]MCP5314453.1 sodium:proton antiporter [Chromatiaceae bacterium]